MWHSSLHAMPWRQQYPPEVPGELDIPDIPVTRLLDDAAERYPRRPALLSFGRRISYRSLREAVDRFAAGLHRLGVQPGDRVVRALRRYRPTIFPGVPTLYEQVLDSPGSGRRTCVRCGCSSPARWG